MTAPFIDTSEDEETINLAPPSASQDTPHKKTLERHKKILDLMDKGMNMEQAVREVGYTDATGITKTKSWLALMDQYLPLDLVAKRHCELLDKRDIRQRPSPFKKGEMINVDYGVDVSAVSKAIELAYKLRGLLNVDATPPPQNAVYNFFYKPEIRERVRVFEQGIKEQLLNDIKTTIPATVSEEKTVDSGGDREGDK